MRHIKANIEVLSQVEIELIHAKSLEVLERTGLRVPNTEILEICHALGCVVDKQNQLLRIPAGVMETALSRNKQHCRAGEPELKKLMGDISTQVFMVDFQTRQKRYGLMEDVLKGIILTDRLGYIRVANSIVIPSDVPTELAEIESFKTIFSYSHKPGGTYVLTPFSAKYVLQMSDVMGIKQSYLFDTISPLSFREESLEIALIYAKSGHLLHTGPMATAGATSPVSISGTLVIENAELLATLFIICALTGSLSFLYAPAHSMDMRTLLCSFGSPNQAFYGVACAQMARYYGLECRSNTGLTDAILPDFQGGFEKGATAVMAHLGGCTEIGCQGIVGADQGFSYEQLVIDNEWLSYYNYILNGIDVSEDAIGMDVIERAGIGGHFMAEEHTALHMRDNNWYSDIFKRDSWESWLHKGQNDILHNAGEYVNTVLANYKSVEPVIAPSTLADINRIAEMARQEYHKKES